MSYLLIFLGIIIFVGGLCDLSFTGICGGLFLFTIGMGTLKK